MDSTVAKKICEALDNVGIEHEFHKSYRGRGCTTATSAVSCASINAVLMAVVNQSEIFNGCEISGFRTDSLGLEVVLY